MRTHTAIVALFVLSVTLLIPAVALGDAGPTGSPDIDGNESATIERIETWQAPATGTGFEDATDVRRAIDEHTLSRATGVDVSHVLVVGLELPGFESGIEAADGSTPTEQFQAALREHGDLEIRQTNMGPNRAHLSLDALNGTGVTVHQDATNDTYYVAIDLANASASRNDSPDPLREDRVYEFAVRATLDADSPLTDDEQIGTTVVAPRSATVDTAPDDRVQLRPLSNQTVTGTTNLGVGETVTVVLRGEADPATGTNESFRITRETTVEQVEQVDAIRDDRGFEVTVDVTDLSLNATNVTVDVRVDGRSMLDTPVPARVNEYSASLDAGAVVEGGGSAGLLVNGALSAGGFYVLHADAADGPIVGHSPYLGPGEANATVYVDRPIEAGELVVVAHRDGNHNQWFDGPDTDTPYPGEGTSDVAAFDVGLHSGDAPFEATPTATPTATTTPTDTAADPTPTQTPPSNGTTPGDGSGSGATETNSDGVLGFGGTVLPVTGALLVALLLVTIVRVR